MKSENFMAEVTLKNQKFKLEGISESNSSRPIEFDFSKPLGDDDGYKGLELLLLAFGGCVSTTMIFLLRKQEKKIESFKLKLEGVKRQNPVSIEKIIFKAVIVSDNISDEDMQILLKKAEKICPVWNMIKGNTEVVGEYNLVNKGE